MNSRQLRPGQFQKVAESERLQWVEFGMESEMEVKKVDSSLEK